MAGETLAICTHTHGNACRCAGLDRIAGTRVQLLRRSNRYLQECACNSTQVHSHHVMIWSNTSRHVMFVQKVLMVIYVVFAECAIFKVPNNEVPTDM